MTALSTKTTKTPTNSAERKRTRRFGLGRSILYVGLFVVSLIPLVPLYWLVISSLKTPNELAKIPATWWPSHLTGDAYRTVFTVVPFAQSFLNSTIITVVCSFSVLITSVLAGFVFAKYTFRGKNVLFWAVIGTMFLPPIVTLVPLYNMITTLGLGDSHLGVMLPWLANAFGIFLMRQFIAEIPDELLDAARVDGASEFWIILRVIMPLLKPATITLLVFSAVFYWNNFLWPLTILQSDDKFPIVVTLSRLLSYSTSVRYQGVVMAGALIASIPTLVIFVLAQRVFVQGIGRSGVK